MRYTGSIVGESIGGGINVGEIGVCVDETEDGDPIVGVLLKDCGLEETGVEECPSIDQCI
ncbi:hypothetical protein D3C80_1989040 [compost metagenome]